MPTLQPQYAQISDFQVAGVPASAISMFTPTQQNQALYNASRLIDGYLRSKFVLPLVQYGQDLARAVAIVAAYDLMVTRGYNPAAGADGIILTRYREIIGTPPTQLGWADLVSNGKIAPDVTDSSSGAQEGVPSSRARVVTASQRGMVRPPRAGLAERQRAVHDGLTMPLVERNPGSLDRLRARIVAVSSTDHRARVSQVMAAAALKQVQDGFVHSRDPYGTAWAAIAWRTGQPLRNTGLMAGSAHAPRVDGGGFSVVLDQHHPGVHNRGATIVPRTARVLRFMFQGVVTFAKKVVIPKRQLVPDAVRGLGLWGQPLREAASAQIRRELTT